MSAYFSITHLTARAPVCPREGFRTLVERMLGKQASISLVFASRARMRLLNRRYARKSYTPNVLAFRLDEGEGEIFICPEVAAREACREGISLARRVAYLFIHGLLHLKGYRHGRTMERQETALLSLLYGTTHRVRH